MNSISQTDFVILLFFASTEGVDEYHGEEHEEGEDEEGDLAPFFQFASEDNGVETALLEACSIVPMVMMVFGH